MASLIYIDIGLFAAGFSIPVVVLLACRRSARPSTQQPQAAIPSSVITVVPQTDVLREIFASPNGTLEANRGQLKRTISSALRSLGKRHDLISRLRTELEARRNQLRANHEQIATEAAAILEAEKALSVKERKLATLGEELAERSASVDAQKIEITVLKTEVLALKARLDLASDEVKMLADRRDAARVNLAAVTEELLQERSKFENFRRGATQLVQKLVVQANEDEWRYQDTQDRLGKESQKVKEAESALEQLRNELKLAHKAQADMRLALTLSDGGANSITERSGADKAKLQGALDRANGERMRLAYELASMKRLGGMQTDNSRPEDCTEHERGRTAVGMRNRSTPASRPIQSD